MSVRHGFLLLQPMQLPLLCAAKPLQLLPTPHVTVLRRLIKSACIRLGVMAYGSTADQHRSGDQQQPGAIAERMEQRLEASGSTRGLKEQELQQQTSEFIQLTLAALEGDNGSNIATAGWELSLIHI